MIKENQRLLNQLNVLSDGVLVFAAMLLAYWVRFHLFPGTVSFPFRSFVWLGLAAVVAAVIIHLIREKKRGKSSCGCHCAGCPMSGACHSRKT